MGFTGCNQIIVYSISWRKKQEQIEVSAPNIDDVKALFEYVIAKIGWQPS